MKWKLGFAVALGGGILGACAPTNSNIAVPTYVSNSIVEMALASIADDACSGISVNEAAVNAYKAEVELRLIGETGSSAGKEAVLKEAALNPKKHLEPGMLAFADRNGMELGDEESFCSGFENEVKRNAKLASLIK